MSPARHISEITQDWLARFDEECDGRRWGDWKLDGLYLEHERTGYWIPVNQLTTRDWSAQIAGKSWASAMDLYDLMRAIESYRAGQPEMTKS
jgi:hypothetical protein